MLRGSPHVLKLNQSNYQILKNLYITLSKNSLIIYKATHLYILFLFRESVSYILWAPWRDWLYPLFPIFILNKNCLFLFLFEAIWCQRTRVCVFAFVFISFHRKGCSWLNKTIKCNIRVQVINCMLWKCFYINDLNFYVKGIDKKI